MSISLDSFLQSLNEEKNGNDIINIVNKLFDAGIFDNDGEFVGWNKPAVEKYGGMSNIEKDLESLKEYLEKRGCQEEKKVYYVIFAAGEGDVDTIDELDETIEAVKEME
jgi:hypothetical protein